MRSLERVSRLLEDLGAPLGLNFLQGDDTTDLTDGGSKPLTTEDLQKAREILSNASSNMKRCIVSKITGAHRGKCYGTCNKHQKSRGDRNKDKAKKADKAVRKASKPDPSEVGCQFNFNTGEHFGSCQGTCEASRKGAKVPAPVPSEAMAQLIELYNSQNWDKLADFVRDVIAEEIRSGCLHVNGLTHFRDPVLLTDKLVLDFAGTGHHEEDLLPTDEQRDRGKFYWHGAYENKKYDPDDEIKWAEIPFGDFKS